MSLNYSLFLKISRNNLVFFLTFVFTLIIIIIRINLLVVYRESVNLIGHITRTLSADSLQL